MNALDILRVAVATDWGKHVPDIEELNRPNPAKKSLSYPRDLENLSKIAKRVIIPKLFQNLVLDNAKALAIEPKKTRPYC